MVAGDVDQDGIISLLDYTLWAADFGKTPVYLKSEIYYF